MSTQKMSAWEFQQRWGHPSPRLPNTKPPSTDAPQPKAKIRLPKLPSANKTEQEFINRAAELLPGHHAGLEAQFSPITLILPSGTRYTPDIVFWEGNKIVAMVETKGSHIHNPTSLEKFKSARAAFPQIQFYFAQKLKTGWSVITA
jgi:hypothetical protein